MSLPDNIYEIIDPAKGSIAQSQWLGPGWANKLGQPRVFYLGGAVRLMAGFLSLHAVRKDGSQITFSEKYKDYLDDSSIKKGTVSPQGVKAYFTAAIAKIPKTWKTHPDFSQLNWADIDLSVGQMTTILNNQPTSLVKCCHVLAVIDAFIEEEKKASKADPRLAAFDLRDPEHGLRIMPAIYILDDFDTEYYSKHFETNSKRLEDFASALGNPGTLFFEQMVRDKLPVTYKTAETIRAFCISQRLPVPGFIKATNKVARTPAGKQPRFRSATGEKADFPYLTQVI